MGSPRWTGTATRSRASPKVPAIDTVIIPNPDQPKLGMGECTFGSTAAAIGNALYHALGVRVCDMPLTRERIATALVR
jgi:nicotinate dehydrogenase subunit B